MSDFTAFPLLEYLKNVSLAVNPPAPPRLYQHVLPSPPPPTTRDSNTTSSSSFSDFFLDGGDGNSSSGGGNKSMTDCTECDVNFDDLYRVLVSCFIVILFGYLAGRTNLISSSQAAGLGMFVSKFSLPALLLKNMIELDFSTVDWMFMVSVLIAKGSLFVLVVAITLLVKHPINLGYAGLFAIFSTQSNDFAVGYPILQALYGKSHKEYLSYLYLVAPISLVLLNPIGFAMLEIHKTRSGHHAITDCANGSTTPKKSGTGMGEALSRVVKGVVTNPIVLMTFLGIIGHFVFNGTVPPYLDDILVVLGQAYNASALFLLGLSMVGKIKGNLGIGLLVPILLITAKTIILPLITWEVVGSLVDSHNGTYSLSMYGFIYGTFPAAPSVFLYASSYNIGEDIIARGIVLGTFLSAPLMFASGKMVTMVVTDHVNHRDELGEATFDISIVSLIASLWVLAVFVFGKKWRIVPHRFTFALIFSQILACVGMMAYYTHARHDPNCVTHYPIIILLLVGVFSARVWTALISVIMCLILTRSLCSVFRFQVWFWFIGWGVPVFLTGVIFMLGRHNLVQEVDPTFHFGIYQTIVSAGLLSICIVVTIASIMIWQRKERKDHHHRTSSVSSNSSPPSSPQRVRASHGTFDECEPLGTENSEIADGQANGIARSYGGTDQQNTVTRYTLNKTPSIEDLIPRAESRRETRPARARTISNSNEIIEESITERTCLVSQCSAEQRHECKRHLKEYAAHVSIQEEVVPDEFQIQKSSSYKLKEEYQSSHHLIMLLVLLLSMFVGLFLCAWRLVHSENSGIYLEIEFLDSFLNYGQGLLFLAVFGFDTKLFLSPLIRRYLSKHRQIYKLYVRVKQWMASSEVLAVPKSSAQLDSKTRNVCRQFTMYHQENCIRDIVRDYRVGTRLYENLFCGSELCDWLVGAGLAKQKEEAIGYGRHLLLGKVIVHVMGQQQFHDAPYYYRFVDNEVDNNC